MNKSRMLVAWTAAAAVGVIGAGAALRLRERVDAHPPGDQQVRSALPAKVAEGPGDSGLARAPIERVESPPSPAPQAAGISPELWVEVQQIVSALTGDEGRQREVQKAFLQMVGRVRDIEKARVRYRIDAEKTVIEIPAFREEGRSIYADWRQACLAVLTPEEGTRLTRSPDFESGKLSPELDLLRAANLFTGSRHGRELEPDFFWDETTRIDAKRLVDGKVQIRVETSGRTAFSQFESQQEALNHLARGYGHLLGPIPQLFR